MTELLPLPALLPTACGTAGTSGYAKQRCLAPQGPKRLSKAGDSELPGGLWGVCVCVYARARALRGHRGC